MLVEDEHEEAGLYPRLHQRTQHFITVQWTYIRDDSKFYDSLFILLILRTLSVHRVKRYLKNFHQIKVIYQSSENIEV